MGRKARGVELYVGTRKGGFIFRSDLKRKQWRLGAPVFGGWEVNHLTRDPRTGWLWSAMGSAWWGNDLQASTNNGKTWTKKLNGLGFAEDRGLVLKKIWRVVPDRESRPNTLWCGTEPGALFRSDDGGENWYEVAGLNQHASREKWHPGGGGLMVHAIVPHPKDANRVSVGISVAGFFRSDDDGKTWTPLNKGVLADFQPDKHPEVGQCVHCVAPVQAEHPEWLFQQNHCGVYRSRNGGKSWQDISKGLPSRFGFPMARHPHEPETIYVVPEYGPERRFVCNQRLGVYRSRNGGNKWELLKKGLPQEGVYTQVLRHCMTTDTCEEAGVYVGTTSGEIYYSRKGGNKWSLLASHLPLIVSLEAAVV